MKPHAKILKNHPVFERFSLRTINRLTAHSTVVRFAKGEVVYQSGQPSEAMYVILSGRCQAFVLLPDGSEQVLEIYAPGDLFGERGVVSGEAYWSTVKVITDCELLRIAVDDVNFLFDRSPKLARQLVMRLVDQFNVYRTERRSAELGRAVVFVDMSAQVKGTVVATNTAAALAQDTGGSVLLVEFARAKDHTLLEDWTRLYHDFLNKHPMDEGQGTVKSLTMYVSNDARERDVVAPLLSEMARRFRYVLVYMRYDVPEAVVTEFIVQADVAYTFMAQRSEDFYRTNLLARQWRDTPAGESAQVYPVICLDYNERAKPFEEVSSQVGVPVQHVVHMLPEGGAEDPHEHYLQSAGGRFSFHIRGLAREIGRCRVGLALSSGGAKGFAYCGVVQVLEEHGIHVDVVAGTSIGAYVGSLWAYGLSGEHLVKLAMDMGKPMALLKLLDPVVPPRQGFIKGKKVQRLLRESVGDAHFSDLVRQLRVVATDLHTLERVVFDSGEVAPAVHASVAMPGVMVPVRRMGRTIIDGGIADPLPVGVLIEMGIEKIIAVNCIPTPEDMRTRAQVSREMATMSKKHVRAIGSLSSLVNYFAPGNILDIMMRGIHGGQTRVAEGACKQADVVLRPVTPDGKWHDFSSPKKYVEMGRLVAERQIDEIKALVK